MKVHFIPALKGKVEKQAKLPVNEHACAKFSGSVYQVVAQHMCIPVQNCPCINFVRKVHVVAKCRCNGRGLGPG